MDGFDTPKQQGRDNAKRRRPWNINADSAEKDADGGQGKLVEFPTRAEPARRRSATSMKSDGPEALLAKLGEQRRRLLDARAELEATGRRYLAKRQEVERERAELEADIAEMRAALANVDSQIREVEMIEEMLRGLQGDE